MEIVLLLVVLVALFSWFVIGGVMKVDRDQNRAEKNAERILDEAFDGRSDVTFKLHMRTLKPETVLQGAKQRGYSLVTQVQGQYGPTAMVFEKAVSALPGER